MSGITHILDMASRALLSEQVGIEVTSHNVTNVNTPGYSRQ
jgi:flagellar hook-associated protein FlgK